VSTPLTLALVGFWHVHAEDYANQVRELESARIAVAWDDDVDRGREGAAALELPFESDLDAILARDDIDGIIVTTSTAAHVDVIGRAIAAGKHVFTEKLLAPTVPECEALIAAAEQAGISLVVSLPRLAEGLTSTVGELIDSGRLGEITYTRVRLAHDGSVAGWLPERFYDRDAAIGGALTDLGCHAVYLTQRLLGSVPESVTAVYSSVTGQQLEDNAIVIMGYEGGALGVAESSNVTTPGASTIEVRGTKASVVYGFAGRGLVGKGESFDAESWVDVPLADDAVNPMEAWLASIDSGDRLAANNAAAVELTRLVVAANESASSGRSFDYAASSSTNAKD